MKALLFVEQNTEEDLRVEDLQTLHQNLTNELCLGEDSQSNFELYRRYILAYNKLQRVKRLNEFAERNKI